MVDSAHRRRDPARESPGRGDRLHQRPDEFAVGLRRQPFRLVALPFSFADYLPVGRHVNACEFANRAPKTAMRQLEFEAESSVPNDLVPSRERPLAISNVGIAQRLIQSIERGLLGLNDNSIDRLQYRVVRSIQLMVVVSIDFLEAALQTRAVVIGSIGR